MSNGIIRTLKRKSAILETVPNRHTGLRAIADNLDRRLTYQAHIELLTEALHRVVTLVYARDAIGMIHADETTGRILIPVPWGRAGRSMWGLYPSEGDTLKIILRSRQAIGGSLFLYDRERRAWCVNLAEYPTERDAFAWLKDYPITAIEFRAAQLKALGKAPR